LILRHVCDREITDSLLLTLALLLIMDDAVRMICGAGIHVIEPPTGLGATFNLLGVSYPAYNLFVIAIGISMVIGLWFFFTRTRWGHIVQAASVDRQMADIIGINVPLTITAIFAFGTWLAAVGGAVAAPLRAIGPGMGDKIIIESFIVVVIGGLGSFPGTFLGAMILGLIHGFGGRYFPGVNLVLPYLGMTDVLLLRPQ